METLLCWQFHLVWSLLEEHFVTLTENDVQWEPVPGMWTVHLGDDGRWRPDWIEPEPEDGPPATIGWLTWHIGWWWTEARPVASHSTRPRVARPTARIRNRHRWVGLRRGH